MRIKLLELRIKLLGVLLRSSKIALFFILYSLFLPLSPAYAQASGIGQARITPASPLYFLKAVRENWQWRFAFTKQAKMSLQLSFADARLKEANTLLSQNQDLIQPTLERHMFNLNSLPDELSEEDELGLKIKEAVNIHLAVLEKMYPLTSNLKARMAIRSVMNRIIQRAYVIPAAKLPVCTLVSREASLPAGRQGSSAFSDTEKFVLANRAEKCFADVGRSGF